MFKGAKHKDGYKIEDEKIAIEMSMEQPEQVFDLRDPTPFRNKAISSDLEDYVVSAVQEFHHNDAMKLHLYFSQRKTTAKKKKVLTDEEICQAIRNHFDYLSKLTDKKLRKFMKTSQMFLFFGIFLLVGCLFAADFVSSFKSCPHLRVLSTGFEVVGWLGLWEPATKVLYDWYPMYEKRKTYDKIKKLQIDITDTQTAETTSNLPSEA